MITLIHTRIRVPHDRIRVTSLKEVEVGTGIAWSAVLRQGRTKIGLISNEGCGGPTLFHPETDSARRTVAAYVESCRDAEGEPMDEENVMDELTSEYEWARDITQAERLGGYAVRHFDAIGIPGIAVFALANTAYPNYQRAMAFAKQPKAQAEVLELPPEAALVQLWMGPDRGWMTLLPDPQKSD